MPLTVHMTLPPPPALKLLSIFKDLIFEYFDIENTYRHFDVGKMLFTQSPKRARCKNTNQSCGTLQGVR